LKNQNPLIRHRRPGGQATGGEEATAALMLIQGRVMTVFEMDVDRYSRTVGLVYTANGPTSILTWWAKVEPGITCNIQGATGLRGDKAGRG